jgi:PKD repeat protein
MVRTARLACVALALAAGCACSPAAPSDTTPVAVVRILHGTGNPPLAIEGYTALTFDGTRSTGRGLKYSWNFGDGDSSSEPLASHVSNNARLLMMATLTVTDERGRQSSASAFYYVASVEKGGPFVWRARVTTRSDVALTDVKMDGTRISGKYWESVQGQGGISRPFTGTLSGANTIIVRTLDGSVELTGQMDWVAADGVRSEPGLRLSARGGMANGVTLLFVHDDPY